MAQVNAKGLSGYAASIMTAGDLGQLLLTWFHFNPSMDK